MKPNANQGWKPSALRVAALSVCFLFAAGCQMSAADADAPKRPSSNGAPARPGHVAELEELEAARRAGTVAAYDLFLARHPNSRYAPAARQERARLAGGQ
jgi:hypothetical protein